MVQERGVARLASEKGQQQLRLVLVVCAVALAWVMSMTTHARAGSVSWISDWVCMFFAIAALARPWLWLAVGVVALALQVFPQQTSMASFVLTMAGAADLNARPPAWLGFTMTLLGLASVAWTAPHEPLVAMGAMAFFMVAPSVSGVLLRTQVHRYRSSLEESYAQRAIEHLAVAREMHDTVALSMSHIVLLATQELHRDDIPARDRGVYTEIQDEARTALQELRQVLAVLRSGADALSTSSVAPARRVSPVEPSPLRLEWDRVRERLVSAGFRDVRTTPLPDAGQLPTDAQNLRTATLAVREMAANILRHGAQEGVVEMVATHTGSHLNLLMSNQASSASAGPDLPRSGHGLPGLRERLAEIGGSLTTLDDQGRWLSVVRIPVEATGDRHDGKTTGEAP